MSKLLSCLLVFTVTVFVAAAAFAADAPKKKEGAQRPSPDQIFKKLDGDNDGKLTVAELAKSKRFNGDEAKAKESLGKMDENKDGSVCTVEWGKAWAKRHAEHAGKGGPRKGGDKPAPKKECPKKQ